MIRDDLTALILTYNEAPNIERTLRQLTWLKKIVVVDSYSTDETLSMLAAFPQVGVYQRKFDSFAAQCNFGLTKIATEWVLSLDADYILTQELIAELESLSPEDSISAYWAKFKYCVWGKPLRGTLYPPRKVLYRRDRAVYEDDGHAHRVKTQGQTAWLSSYILHDDRKSLSHWLLSQDKYMIREVEKIRQMPTTRLSIGDSIRRSKILAPFVVLFYCLILQKGIFDGWAGWYYALQRALAEILLAIRLIESDRQSASQALPTEFELR